MVHRQRSVIRNLILAGLLIAATAGVVTIVLYDHLTGQLPWKVESHVGSSMLSIDSKVLQEEREFQVWLPVKYDSTLKYPVIYALDGSSQGAAFVNAINVLSLGQIAPAAIVVGIPNLSDETRQRDLTPPMMKQDVDKPDSPAGEGDKFLQFIETELIPYVEENYPASGRRAFSGNSRGGLLVMHSLITHPDLFHARFCFSTPFWRQENLLLNELDKFLQTRDTLKTFLYASAGEKETENIKQGANSLVGVFQLRAPFGLSWQVDSTPGGDHQTNAERSIPGALAMWLKHPDPD